MRHSTWGSGRTKFTSHHHPKWNIRQWNIKKMKICKSGSAMHSQHKHRDRLLIPINNYYPHFTGTGIKVVGSKCLGNVLEVSNPQNTTLNNWLEQFIILIVTVLKVQNVDEPINSENIDISKHNSTIAREKEKIKNEKNPVSYK